MKNNKARKQTPCKQCKYYFGKNTLHCAVHPYGQKSEYCPDWQKQTRVEQVITLVKAKTHSFKKAVNCLLSMAVVAVMIAGLYQTVIVAIDNDQKNARYVQECDIFLERAVRAGITSVAADELTVAVNWLEAENLTQSFEVKNLKSNLIYLKKQPSDSVIPIVIRDSINKSAESIRRDRSKKQHELSLKIGLTATALILTAYVVFCLTFALVNRRTPEA